MSSRKLLIVWLSTWCAFFALAWLVRRGATQRLDASLESRLEALASSRLERLGEPMTQLGMAEVTLGLATLLTLAALVLGWYRLSLAVSLVWLSLPVELAFKWFLHTPDADPPLRAAMREVLIGGLDPYATDLAHPPGSFPSGHVARTAFLAGLLVVLLLGARLSWRARLLALPFVAAAGIFALVMGYTRVLTGQHTPVDVLGGYLLAASLLLPVPLLLGWPSRVKSYE